MEGEAICGRGEAVVRFAAGKGAEGDAGGEVMERVKVIGNVGRGALLMRRVGSWRRYLCAGSTGAAVNC